MWNQKFLQRALAAALLIGLTAAAPGQRQPVKLETLPSEEFQKLPGTAIVEFQGRSMTKDQFLAEVRQKKSRSSSGPRAGADPGKEFEQKEKARIAAKNSSLRASQPPSGISAEKSAEACNSPRIYSLDAAPPPLEPGQWVRINGCGFGSHGSVKLFGVFSGGSLNLTPVKGGDCSCDSWKNHSILVEVPPGVSGVTDQNLVQLQVASASSEKSNLWQTSFRAARVAVRLPFSALQVSCAKVGPGNVCQATLAPFPPGAFGRHGNPGLSFGTDSYAVSLINSWEAHSLFVNDLTDHSMLQPCIGFAVKGGSQTGANARVDVEWLEYENDCPARYVLLVHATGPKGIPYQ